jgi:hypothetical protein
MCEPIFYEIVFMKFVAYHFFYVSYQPMLLRFFMKYHAYHLLKYTLFFHVDRLLLRGLLIDVPLVLALFLHAMLVCSMHLADSLPWWQNASHPWMRPGCAAN